MFSANSVSAGVPGQNWIAKTGPIRNYEDGAYGNGKYLYLANNAYLAISTDTNTWTESLAMRSATTVNTGGIVYSSWLNGFFVGREGGVVYSFDDGVSWVAVAVSGVGSVQTMISGSSAILGYDSGGRVLRSTNGTSWTNLGTMTTLAGWGSGAFASGLYGGDYGNGIFMLVGGNVSPSVYATCAKSSDGLTWTNLPNLDVTFSGSMARGVTWSQTLGKWFAWSSDSKIAYSDDDGSSWTISSGASSLLSGFTLRWITEVNGTLVASALKTSTFTESLIITSADGVNWQSSSGLTNIGVYTDSYLKNENILVVAQPTLGKFAVSV
jgi:hypothetical protein